MNSLNAHIHKSYGGLIGSLERQNKRDKSLIEKVFSSGFNDDHSKRKPFQHDNSLPRPFTGDAAGHSNNPLRQKSKVVQKIRKAIEEKKTKQKDKKDAPMEEIHLLEKFIFICKNFMNSCSRLIKTYSEVINEQDPLVKTVLSNRLQLSRIVHDIQKHNIFKMEQENQELKKMIDRLKKMMSLSKYKQPQMNVNDQSLHKQSYQLIKKLLKERFELKDYLDFERVIETSEREIKIRNILMEKNLCSKSQKKFVEMLESVEKEKVKVFNNLLRVRNGEDGGSHQIVKEGYEVERSLNRKLKELLLELNVQVNTNSSIDMFELLEIKIVNMRAELIPSLMQSHHSFNMEIIKLSSQLENKTSQLQKNRLELDSKALLLQKKSHEVSMKTSEVMRMERENKRLQEQLKDIQFSESTSTLTKFKQPQFKQFNSEKKIQELEESHSQMQKQLSKYHQQLKSLCENYGITLDNQEDNRCQSLLEAIDLCILSYNTKLMEIEKQNAFLRRKNEDIEQEFENVLRDKLRFEEDIEHLRNKNKEYEAVSKQRLQFERKRSSSEKQKQAEVVSRIREQYLMSLNDCQGEIGRLREKIRMSQEMIFDLEGKMKVRDEINQEMMQEKIVIEEELGCKVELMGSLEINSRNMKREKEEMEERLERLEGENSRMKEEKLLVEEEVMKYKQTVQELNDGIEVFKNKTMECQTRLRQFNRKLRAVQLSIDQLRLIKTNLMTEIHNHRALAKDFGSQGMLESLNQIVSGMLSSQSQELVGQISTQFNTLVSEKQSIFTLKLQSEMARLNQIDLSTIHNICKKQSSIKNTFQTQTEIPELFADIGINTLEQAKEMHHYQLQTEPVITLNYSGQTQQILLQSIDTNTSKVIVRSGQEIGEIRMRVIGQLKECKGEYDSFRQRARVEMSQYKSYVQGIVTSVGEFLSKEHCQLDTLFRLLESKLKLEAKSHSVESYIEVLSKYQYKQPPPSSITPSSYYQTLQKMIEQFLYNKVNLNLQQQIKALPQQEKQKITRHKKKIGELQDQLTNKDQLTQKIAELMKSIETLKGEHKNLQKKLEYYQQDNNQKESLIQQLKSNNKQMLNCIEIPNDTLSLIGEEDNSETESNLNEILLCDLLDQSGICNDQLEFTKTQLTKALKQLNAVKGKLRVLEKNSRQIINYLKLSIMSMIEAIEGSKDDGSTLKHVLSELRGCRVNIK